MTIQSARSLNLDHLRKQAKELLKQLKAKEPQAVELLAAHAPELAAQELRLSLAQYLIARQYGYDSWPRLKQALETRAPSDPFQERIEALQRRAFSRLQASGSAFEEQAERRDGAWMHRPLPLLPIRNHVLFPGALVPFVVGRESSLALARALARQSDPVFCAFCQRDPQVEMPAAHDLLNTGVVARMLELEELPGGGCMLTAQGQLRVRLQRVTHTAPYLMAEVKADAEPKCVEPELTALAAQVRELAVELIALLPAQPYDAARAVRLVRDPSELADLVAANLQLPPEAKEPLLAEARVGERLRKVTAILGEQLQALRLAGTLA